MPRYERGIHWGWPSQGGHAAWDRDCGGSNPSPQTVSTNLYLVIGIMIRIDTNHNTSFSLYFKGNQFLLVRGKSCPADAEIYDNFVFSATIVPVRWFTTRSSGNILFRDASDGFDYRMTQASVFNLLNGILSGDIKVERGGFSGLFTFRSTGQNAILDVFGGY